VYWSLAYEFVFYVTIGFLYGLLFSRHIAWTLALAFGIFACFGDTMAFLFLAKMSGVITGEVLGSRSRDPEARAALTGELEQQAEQAKREGFDLDAMLDGDLQEPPRPMPTLTLHDLDMALQRADSLPAALAVKKLQDGEYAYQAPGMANPIRITTRPDYFDEHSDSLELWSPGSPSFPVPEAEVMQQELAGISISTLLNPAGT
jgi:hypothetical protein